MGQKTHHFKNQKWVKNGNFEKTLFSRLAIKWAKQGVFVYLNVYLESQKHNKDIGNG